MASVYKGTPRIRIGTQGYPLLTRLSKGGPFAQIRKKLENSILNNHILAT